MAKASQTHTGKFDAVQHFTGSLLFNLCALTHATKLVSELNATLFMISSDDHTNSGSSIICVQLGRTIQKLCPDLELLGGGYLPGIVQQESAPCDCCCLRLSISYLIRNMYCC